MAALLWVMALHLGSNRVLNHPSDDPGEEHDREAYQGIDDGGLAALHLVRAAGGAHVKEGAPHHEEGSHGGPDAHTDVEQVFEESVDLFHHVGLLSAGPLKGFFRPQPELGHQPAAFHTHEPAGDELPEPLFAKLSGRRVNGTAGLFGGCGHRRLGV